MDLELTLDEELVRQIDRLVGPDERSAFIEDTVRKAVLRARRERPSRSPAQVEDLWGPDRAEWQRRSAG